MEELPWARIATDNLYKFMALAGLASLLLSNGFLHVQISRLEERVIETGVEGHVLEEDVKLLEWDTKRLESEVKRLEESDADDTRAASASEARLQLENLEKKLDSLHRRRVETAKLHYRLVGKRVLNDSLLEQLKYANILVIFINAFCGGVTALGFTLWYYKHQKFQDRIVQKQASLPED